MEYIQWNKATEIEDLAAIQIGVMPLKDSIWAKGKCGFKGLQYMALEIPSVMSNVGVNTEIIQHEQNGFLCEKNEDWERILRRLISDKNLRKTIGSIGKQTVKERYSVESQKENYLSLFE